MAGTKQLDKLDFFVDENAGDFAAFVLDFRLEVVDDVAVVNHTAKFEILLKDAENH